MAESICKSCQNAETNGADLLRQEIGEKTVRSAYICVNGRAKNWTITTSQTFSDWLNSFAKVSHDKINGTIQYVGDSQAKIFYGKVTTTEAPQWTA